jgi:hypothetical protein
MVGVELMISKEGLHPLRDVDNLGSRVGMGEVGVMEDW